MRDGKPTDPDLYGNDAIPARLLQVDVEELKKTVQWMMRELIGPCSYCTEFSGDICSERPIACSKQDAPHEPGWITLETCFSCGKFRE
jgi:hypothetical protein